MISFKIHLGLVIPSFSRSLQ